MGPNFDGFNHPDPIQKLQKPVTVDILANGAPSSPGTYDRAPDSIHPKITQNKARLLKMYCLDIA